MNPEKSQFREQKDIKEAKITKIKRIILFKK